MGRSLISLSMRMIVLASRLVAVVDMAHPRSAIRNVSSRMFGMDTSLGSKYVKPTVSHLLRKVN